MKDHNIISIGRGDDGNSVCIALLDTDFKCERKGRISSLAVVAGQAAKPARFLHGKIYTTYYLIRSSLLELCKIPHMLTCIHENPRCKDGHCNSAMRSFMKVLRFLC
jgi:hypothetical protein